MLLTKTNIVFKNNNRDINKKIISESDIFLNALINKMLIREKDGKYENKKRY
jgi:hypothetical protein